MGSSVKELLRNGPKPWLKIIAESVDIVDFKVLGDIGTADQVLRKNSSNVLGWSEVHSSQYFATQEGIVFGTTSGTFVTGVTYNTSNLAAGTYKFEYTCQIANNTGAIVHFRIINVTDTNKLFMESTLDLGTTDFAVQSGFIVETTLTGVNAIAFQIHISAGGTAELTSSRLLVTRIE